MPDDIHSARLASSTALGTASELQAAASLLRLGLQVARPVVDGDGVDLVVYGSGRSLTLQVRSSALHEIVAGYRYRWHVFPTARLRRLGGPDFFVFHGRGEDEAWWIVPLRVLRREGVKSGINLRLGAKGRSRRWERYRDAWHLIEEALA